jgi:hypothetical protein
VKGRVAAIERRIRGATGPLVIIIRRGLPTTDGDPDPKFAKASGGTRWDRGRTETFAEFRVRVMAAAVATGQKHIVFGGLSRV